MDEKEIARRLLHNFGIRIEAEMSAYARRQLERHSAGDFHVMGLNARTGVPTRTLINVQQLRARNSPGDGGGNLSDGEIARQTY